MTENSPLTDPRARPDFDPRFLPRCDGAEPPPAGATDKVECRKIEFLAAYYRLNELYAQLLAVREGAAPAGDEKPVLHAIQVAIRDRDALEDKYAPEGFIGEPVMDGIFYKDLEFSYAKRREYYQPASSSSFSLFIPMPPPGTDMEAWVRQHVAGLFPEFAESAASASGTSPGEPTVPAAELTTLGSRSGEDS